MYTKFNVQRFFDISSICKPKPEKRISGDYVYHKIIKKENAIVCALADGVSTRKDDWLASQTACLSAIEYFSENNEAFACRLKNAVMHAHFQVKDSNNPKHGMACSMCMIAWEYTTNIFLYVNVGDTRVHLIRNNEIKLLTRDDTEPVRITIGGKPLFNNGSPVFFDAMVKIIGQESEFDITVSQEYFQPGDSVVLSSDGIHKKGGLSQGIVEVLSSNDINQALEIFLDNCIEYIEDDASIIVLRRNDLDIEIEQEILNMINGKVLPEELRIRSDILSDLIIDAAFHFLEISEAENFKKCLTIIELHSLFPRKDILIKLLNKYCEKKINDRNIYSLLSSMIKKASLKN